jgi:o-succinylbenzoate synthase
MQLHFQFRRYRLPFRTTMRTAHGPWLEREGVIVRLEDASKGSSGAVGFGEAAPIAWFGTEKVDEVEEGCRGLGEWIEETSLQETPKTLGCLRHALSSALAELRGRGSSLEGREARSEGGDGDEFIDTNEERVTPTEILRLRAEGASDTRTSESSRPSTPRPSPSSPTLGLAALLPAGKSVLSQIEPKAEVGFRVFKWKVGVGDLADELALLDDVCAALPSGATLRLDANGAWNRRQAERWLERCADRPVEFVEQPIAADARGAEDLLLGLAGDYPTAIALDESLVGEADLEKWIGTGWPGVFVVKPALFADVTAALARLEQANASVVFSSALETALGAKAALRSAFAWKGELDSSGHKNEASSSVPRRRRALGFGVWPLFADARFDVPFTGAFVRYEDVERINSESVWNALS